MNNKIRITLILSGLLPLLITPTQGAPDYALSNRPIVIAYVNALRSATGQDQPLSSAQIDAEMAALHREGYNAVVHALLESQRSHHHPGWKTHFLQISRINSDLSST